MWQRKRILNLSKIPSLPPAFLKKIRFLLVPLLFQIVGIFVGVEVIALDVA